MKMNSKINKKRVLQITVGVVITVVSLYFAFRGIDFKESLEIIKNIKVIYLIFSVIVGTSIVVLRALRWQCFIPLKNKIRKSTIVASVYIGYMANNILPAKLGEVVRAYVLGNKENISKTAIFASVISERLFDVFTGVLMLAVAIIFIPSLPKTIFYGAVLLFVICIIGGCLLVFISKKKDFAFSVFSKVISFLPKKIKEKTKTMFHKFIEGIGFRADKKHIFFLIFYTITYWGGQVISVLLLFKAFSIDGSPALALFTIAAMGFGFAVPAAPSGIGPIEWIVIFALTLVGVDKTLAASFAFVYHLIGIIPVTAVGFFSLLYLGIDLKTATRSDGEK